MVSPFTLTGDWLVLIIIPSETLAKYVEGFIAKESFSLKK